MNTQKGKILGLAHDAAVRLVRREAALVVCLGLYTYGLGLCANAQDRKTTIITFDVPGAGTGAHQGKRSRKAILSIITAAGLT